MSDSSSVIKEFLVKLGVTVDASAIKKFEEGIVKTTKTIVGLAVAMEATAIAVSVGVAKMAASLEDLYFASMRTGTAASSLKAFDRAAMSFGTSAGQALQSAEGLARFFRNNPGGANYLNAFLGQIGESAFNANGSIKETDQLLVSLGKLFANNTKRGIGFQNTQIASMLGIDEKTMLAIQNGDFEKKMAEEKLYNMQSGLDGAAGGAHRFMESLRKLDDQLYVFGVRVTESLQGKLGISLDTITNWFHRNGPWLANQVTDLVGSWIDDFNKVLHWTEINWPRIKAHIIEAMFNVNWAWEMYVKPALEWMMDKFAALDEKTGGWASTILVLTAVLNKLGALGIVTGVLQLAAAFTTLSAALLGLGGGAAILGGILAALTAVPAALGVGWGIGKLIDAFFPEVEKPFIDMFQNIHDKRHPKEKMINDLMGAGFSHSQASGIAGNLWQESSFNADARNVDAKGNLHYGLAQLGPAEQDIYENLMGHPIQEDWYKPENQTAFLFKRMQMPDMRNLWEGLKAHAGDTDMNADFNARLFDRLYERPGDYDREDPKRAAAAVSISNDTKIHITAPDAEAAGRSVKTHLEQLQRDQRRVVREFAFPGVS